MVTGHVIAYVLQQLAGFFSRQQRALAPGGSILLRLSFFLRFHWKQVNYKSVRTARTLSPSQRHQNSIDW